MSSVPRTDRRVKKFSSPKRTPTRHSAAKDLRPLFGDDKPASSHGHPKTDGSKTPKLVSETWRPIIGGCCPHLDPAAVQEGRLLQIGTHREKKHVLTLTLMLVRRKSACKTSAGSSKIFRWLAPLLGPNLDPKTGPKQRPKRRNENVIQFWTPFWGPYLDPKMGSAIGEFRCCPQMFCKQICDPAA